MRFSARPFEIEAIQFTGKNGAEVKAFCAEGHTEAQFITKGMSASTGNQAWNYVKDGRKWKDSVRAAVYDYLQGDWIPVNNGDWIIRGSKGEFYPCDDDVFKAKYEEKK